MFSATSNSRDVAGIRDKIIDAKSITFSHVVDVPVVLEEIDVVLAGTKAQESVGAAFEDGQEVAQLYDRSAIPSSGAHTSETWAHRGASKGYREFDILNA